MRLRRPPRPSALPLGRPGPDGGGWPDREDVGRPTFASSTLHEMALRAAYEPEAHAIGDRLIGDVLPRVDLVVSDEDEPYLRKVLLTAARIGAGVGIVERSAGPQPVAGQVDRDVAAALWRARRALPAMPPAREQVAAYFLLAGFVVARGGPAVVGELRAALG